MTKAELERFQSMLETARKRLTGDVTHLTEEAMRGRTSTY